MKKLLFGAAALFLMASCAGNGTSEKAREDSARIADSIAQVKAAEEARLDSIRLDSIAKAEAQAKAAEYDELIDQYVKTVNKYGKLRWDMRDWTEQEKLFNKYHKLEKQINQIKGDLNSEQLSKFKKAKAEAIKWEDWN